MNSETNSDSNPYGDPYGDSEGQPVTSATPNRATPKRVSPVLALILVQVLLAVGVVAYNGLAAQKPEVARRETSEKVFNVSAFAVEAVDLEEVIFGFGTVTCEREVIVSAQVSGEIVETHPRLKVGEVVSDGLGNRTADGQTKSREGDLLVRIDPRPYQERVTQARNRLGEVSAGITSTEQQIANNRQLFEKAQRDFASYEKEYERVKRSKSKGVATASDLTRTLLELQKYQDNVLRYETESKLLPLTVASSNQRKRSLQNDLKLAELELKKTEVRPAFGGRLSEVMVELGQFVRSGEAIARVSDLAMVEVAVPLALSDYSKLEADVRQGQQPIVELAATETGQSKWTGRLTRVAPEADKETRTIKVFVQVDNQLQKSPLLPGMFVNVRIGGPTHKSAMPIPRDAIRKGHVFVAVDGKSKRRPVSVVHKLQTLAMVDGPISAGDQLILTNLDSLFDDAPVLVQQVQSLDAEMQAQRTQLVKVLKADD